MLPSYVYSKMFYPLLLLIPFFYPYTTIRHYICLKTVLYFWKRIVLKVLCYQNIYAEKHQRHVHCIVTEGHTNDKRQFKVTKELIET